MSLMSDMADALTSMIDIDVFGRSVTVDGVPVIAIFSPPEKALAGTPQQPFGLDGVHVETRTLYCKTDDVAAPVTGQELTIDGDRWNVGSVDSWTDFFGAECMRYLS